MGIIGKRRWQKNVSTCNRSIESIQSEEDKEINWQEWTVSGTYETIAKSLIYK